MFQRRSHDANSLYRLPRNGFTDFVCIKTPVFVAMVRVLGKDTTNYIVSYSLV